jgi:F-type H+-transporting ATPase subunit b
VEQAKRSAEQEGKAEFDAILARVTDDIVAAMEKGLVERLDEAGHQNLIDKALTKVVFQ